MTATTKCRSKNPKNCPYHGQGQSFTVLEVEANKQAKAGNFEKYTFIRNAMDEILRDEAFEADPLPTEVSYVATLDRVEAARSVVTPTATTTDAEQQLSERELAIRAEKKAEKVEAFKRATRQRLYETRAAEYDKKFKKSDKQAAESLKLRVSKTGGIAFKFYDPITPIQRNPDNYTPVTATIGTLKHGDVISQGTVHSVTRQTVLSGGKAEVIIQLADGNYVKNVWNSDTPITANRLKEQVLV